MLLSEDENIRCDFLPRDRFIKKTRMGLRSAVTRNFSRRMGTAYYYVSMANGLETLFRAR